jgi:hypothetical protein
MLPGSKNQNQPELSERGTAPAWPNSPLEGIAQVPRTLNRPPSAQSVVAFAVHAPVVMRPIVLSAASVNHRAPSSPVTICSAETNGRIGNFVTSPEVVIRPMPADPMSPRSFAYVYSENQTLPPGPSAMA